MRNLPSYEKFINESLVILSMKDLMKNEFMNNIELKADFEMAKRLFFDNGGSLLTHVNGDKFELRTYTDFTKEDLTNMINTRINPSTTRMKFSRKGVSKLSNLKEHVWLIIAKIRDYFINLSYENKNLCIENLKTLKMLF